VTIRSAHDSTISQVGGPDKKVADLAAFVGVGRAASEAGDPEYWSTLRGEWRTRHRPNGGPGGFSKNCSRSFRLPVSHY